MKPVFNINNERIKILKHKCDYCGTIRNNYSLTNCPNCGAGYSDK